MSSSSNRRAFVRALAKFLVEDAAEMSIKLELGTEEAKRWARLREASPVFGYPTVDEAEAQLLAWLSGGWAE